MLRSVCYLILAKMVACLDLEQAPISKYQNTYDVISDAPQEFESADTFLIAGLENGVPVDAYPYPITLDHLWRGKMQYDIFCTGCHGTLGYGDGEWPQRGGPHVPTFHSDHSRAASLGHLFQTIVHGSGSMYAFGSQMSAYATWNLVAYVRALQLSQNATLYDIPIDTRGTVQ